MQETPSIVLSVILLSGLAPTPSAAQQAESAATSAPSAVAPSCQPGARWTEGTPIYRESTADWGLVELGVEGLRINVTDIDGDGWPDLHVRRAGIGWNDPTDEGRREVWLLRNTGRGAFEDVTAASGILTPREPRLDELGRPGEVAVWADVDNDGDLDVYTGLSTADRERSGDATSELLLNDGTGRFVLGPVDSDLRRAGLVDVPAGAAFTDVDRDGDVDLWVGQHNHTLVGTEDVVFMQDRLYLGDGTGRFVDVTEAAGLLTTDWSDLANVDAGLAHSRSWGVAACDLDDDGWPELLSPGYGRSPNHLWLAESNPEAVRYRNHSVASGYAYDQDFTWQDNQFAMCFCQRSPDAEGCADVGEPTITCDRDYWTHEQDRQPFRLGGNSGATICADLDNDGDLDLLTGEIKHWWAGAGSDGSEVLVNDGARPPTFARPGDAALGLAVAHTETRWDEGHMTSTVLDIDNDGWLDIYIGASDYPGNRGLLYHQSAPLAFAEVPTADFFEHNRSHGVVAADFDRDGDLDLVVGHSRARCNADGPNDCYPRPQLRLFENVLGETSNWLQLALEGGPGVNRSAVGARVTVTADGVVQTREVGGGYGHYGAQDDLVIHVGLGAACQARVEVRWPDADLTRHTFELQANRRYRISSDGRVE